MKYIFIIFYSLYININNCLAIDDLIAFKNDQQGIIKANNIEVVYRAGETVLGKYGQSYRDKIDLISEMEQKHISPQWLEWFKRRFKNFDSISYKQFAAAIFYPLAVST